MRRSIDWEVKTARVDYVSADDFDDKIKPHLCDGWEPFSVSEATPGFEGRWTCLVRFKRPIQPCLIARSFYESRDEDDYTIFGGIVDGPN